MTFAREANRSAHAARKTNSILCRAMSAERAVIIEGFIGGDVKAPTDRAVHGVARSLLRQSRRRYLGRRRHSTCSLQWRRALVVSSLGQTERDVPRHWSCHLHWQRQAVKTARASYYSAHDRGAEYCDEPVCLCVCVFARACVCVFVHFVRDHILGTKRPIFANFCACCLWPWLGPPLAS